MRKKFSEVRPQKVRIQLLRGDSASSGTCFDWKDKGQGGQNCLGHWIQSGQVRHIGTQLTAPDRNIEDS